MIMDKKQIFVYTVSGFLGSLVAMMIITFIYKMAFFSVYGIDITQYVSFGEVLANSLVPWLIFVLLILTGLLLILFLMRNYFPYIEYLKQKSMGKEKTGIAKKIDEIKERLKSISWVAKRIESNQKFEEEKKERRAKLEALNHYSFFTFYVWTILLIFFYWGLTKKLKVSLDTDMILLMGIILPIAFYLALQIGSLPITKPEGFMRVFKKPGILLLQLIVPFLVYAVALSYSAGIEGGTYQKHNQHIVFEIKALQGEQFTEADYDYIGQMNDNVFLLDKNTDHNVILPKSSLQSMKIEPSWQRKSFFTRLEETKNK